MITSLPLTLSSIEHPVRSGRERETSPETLNVALSNSYFGVLKKNHSVSLEKFADRLCTTRASHCVSLMVCMFWYYVLYQLANSPTTRHTNANTSTLPPIEHCVNDQSFVFVHIKDTFVRSQCVCHSQQHFFWPVMSIMFTTRRT